MSRRAPLVVLCLYLAAACGEDDEGGGNEAGVDDGGSDDGDEGGADGGDPGDPPFDAGRLFEALNQGAYDQLDDIIDEYTAAYEADPTFVTGVELLGAAHLWRVAEAERDPETEAMVAQTHGPLVARYLGEVIELNPAHTFAPGLLGVTLWDAGGQTGDTALQEQGAALLDQVTETHPELGHFLKILAYQQEPVDDPAFATAVESLWQWLEVCVGEPVDRSNPDLTPYFTEERIDGWTGERRFCWESELVPNAAKGAYTLAGDILVKQGEVDAGRVMYENATQVDGYDAWPHRDVIESRLKEDLEARAALYRDPDPSVWPEQGKPPLSCTLCHQAR
jgi:hypothetical protein